ncbi:MAG TPA: hypothetical protein VNA28_12525 [Solirubrobacteraceae bacterium]|nr:hypothetical protein [Solirubrobacteraceae bacterium]
MRSCSPAARSGGLLAQGAAPNDERVARAALTDATGATVGNVR